jgi:phage tail-like protein
MAVTGQPRNWLKRFKFIVEIDGIFSSAFSTCSELSAEIAEIEHSEGGVIAPDKSPGRVTVTDLTLERGATSDIDMYLWFKEVANIAANAGVVSPNHERTLDVVAQRRDGTTVYRWRCYRCWPKKYMAGDWDNNADETLIESVTLSVHHFDRIG